MWQLHLSLTTSSHSRFRMSMVLPTYAISQRMPRIPPECINKSDAMPERICTVSIYHFCCLGC